MYEVQVTSEPRRRLDDISGPSLPPERVFIFHPEDYQDTAEWMAIAVKRYWQTKTMGLYAAGLMDMHPGPIMRRRNAVQTTQAGLQAEFAKIYAPDNLKLSDRETLFHYDVLYERWRNGDEPVYRQGDLA
jgi:hypothetical protein